MYISNLEFKISLGVLIKHASLCALFISLLTVSKTGAATSVNHNQSDVQSASNSLALYVGETKLLHLPKKAATIFIADPEIASFQTPTESSLLLFSQNIGHTTLYALDKNGQQIYSTEVKVSVDLTPARQHLRQYFPDAKVQLALSQRQLMVTGVVNSQQQASEIIAAIEAMMPNTGLQSSNSDSSQNNGSQQAGNNRGQGSVGQGSGISGYKSGRFITNLLRVNAPNQVNVRVRIAEVSKRVVDNFEFTWNPEKLGSGMGLAIAPTSAGVSTFSNLLSGASPESYFSDATSMIDILAQENLLKVLAEPNLTVKSGESASFLAGGELLIPVVGEDNQLSLEEKEFGVQLDVTATILSGNRISLRVRPEISDVTDTNSIAVGGIQTPSIETRAAQTTIELASGQSFAIAGMLRSSVSNDVSKVPGLADIPILGKLFQSQSYINRETELVMVATVHLVQPVSQPIALPTDNFSIQSPFEKLIKKKGLVSDAALQSQGVKVDLGDFVY